MTDESATYEGVRRDGVLRIRQPGAEWLSTGPAGGRVRADCAYNVSVPDSWNRTDLDRYVDERLERAGFDDRLERADSDVRPTRDRRRERTRDGVDGRGPALLTGVDIADARGARCGPVTAYATAGISNPAALPMEPAGGSLPDDRGERAGSTGDANGRDESTGGADSNAPGAGTINVVVGTTRSLAPGALANLIAVAAEAKTATVLAMAGVPGTTTDAVVAGHDPAGQPTTFSGSATPVGAAARACVRDAVRASLRAHYATIDESLPASVSDASYGVSTDVEADVFCPAER